MGTMPDSSLNFLRGRVLGSICNYDEVRERAPRRLLIDLDDRPRSKAIERSIVYEERDCASRSSVC